MPYCIKTDLCYNFLHVSVFPIDYYFIILLLIWAVTVLQYNFSWLDINNTHALFKWKQADWYVIIRAVLIKSMHRWSLAQEDIDSTSIFIPQDRLFPINRSQYFGAINRWLRGKSSFCQVKQAWTGVKVVYVQRFRVFNSKFRNSLDDNYHFFHLIISLYINIF